MRTLLQFLGCDTLEDCRRIQRGYLPLRRLGKWSVLFTVAFVLLMNDAVAVWTDRMVSQYEEARGLYEKAHDRYKKAHDRYTEATSSVLYRWTVGWFVPPVELPSPTGLPDEAPKLDKRALLLYNLLNWGQFLVFLGYCGYCLRWVYADYRAEGNAGGFSKFCLSALISNLALYFSLRVVVLGFLG